MRTATYASADVRLIAPPPSTALRSLLRSRIGDLTWVAFVLVQVADGALTYIGVSTLGPHAEANPLLAWCIAAAGVGLALFGAKAFALGCGTLLHVQCMHRCLAALTTLYAGAAVWGWIVVLWPVTF